MTWDIEDYRSFHRLREKASCWDLEVAYKILGMELSERVEREARAQILSTYMEDDGNEE